MGKILKGSLQKRPAFLWPIEASISNHLKFQVNMKVGFCSTNYLYRRNVIDKVSGLDYVKIHDINKVLQYISVLGNRVMPQSPIFRSPDAQFHFNDFNLNKVDFLHLFNKVSFANTPWVSTFETVLPRYRDTKSCHHGRECTYRSLIQNKSVKKALEAMAGDACIQLIAMSRCSVAMQKDLLKHFPAFASEIEAKLTCLHPPQEVLLADLEEKNLSDDNPIHFMLVGSSFFRKGGMEVLKAFQAVQQQKGYNLKLTIVSSLSLDNYAAQETVETVREARSIISQNESWIEHFDHLPNARVIEIMKTAHVGLLPTYADTYGFSVLEFQSTGCPVISTNVRALPEINNDRVGWMIEVPKNRLGEAKYTTREDREEISSCIFKGLQQIVTEIMENRKLVLIKAAAAIERIRSEHSPDVYAENLDKVYRKAF